MSDFFKRLAEALQKVFEDQDLPVPARLSGLQPAVQQLSSLTVDWTGGGVEAWLNSFRSLVGDRETQDTLLVRALQVHLPRLAEALTLLGVARYTFAGGQVQALPLDRELLKQLLASPDKLAIHLAAVWLSRIASLDDIKLTQVYAALLLFAPMALLKLEYGGSGFASLPSGQPGFSTDPVLDEIKNLINSPFPIRIPTDFPADLQEFKTLAANSAGAANDFLAISGPDDLATAQAFPFNGFGVEVKTADAAALAANALDLGGGWRVSFAAGDGGQRTFRVMVLNGGIDTALPSDGEFEVRLAREPAPGQPAIVFGPAGETHVELGKARFAWRVHSQPPLFSLRLRLERAAFVLASPHLKLIAGSLPIPKELRFEADVNIAYLQGQGIQAQGAQGGAPVLGVQFAAPLQLTTGSSSAGLTVNGVLVRLEMAPAGFDLRARLTFAARAQLGPLRVQMEGAGVWFGRWQGASYGLEAPAGFGIALEAGPISGGGFLARVGPDEYAGALQIKILGVGAFAFGIYKGMPGGDPSFVAMLGIRFPAPGIQLSWGFALTGVGGLVGVNRRADTDLLRDRLASGAAGNVLFCDDPVKNAPALLNDMRLFFPDEPGVFLLGPTLQVNWAYLLFLDLGVFVELPGPRKIFVAGSARLVVGASAELALVYLRLDFIGGIDFTRQLIFLDAALVNSHVLQILDITGGVALRIGYGSNAYFLFSVGGFHASFNPGALEVPKLARAGASLSISVLAEVWLKLEMYLAITPNTLQLGASIEAGIELGPINVHGWFKFDALIQFTPFYFIAEIDAGFDVEVFGESLYGVRVQGKMTGPGPIVIHARARVKLLFVPVSGSATIRLGKDAPSGLQPITNVVERLKGEISHPQNLRAEGDDRSVILNPRPGTGEALLLAPVGTLVWEQKRAPLGRDLQRFEGVDLDGVHRLEVSCPIDTQPETDWFSFGMYSQVSASESLNTARFTEEKSGLRVRAGDADLGSLVAYEVKIDLWKLPKRTRLSALLSGLYLPAALLDVARERDRLVPPRAGQAMVEVKPEAWNAYTAGGAVAGADLSPAQAFMQARALGGVALSAAAVPVDLQGV